MKTDDRITRTDIRAAAGGNPKQGKSAWVDPKLEFVEPKLTRHGELERLTGGFFGTFSP